MAAAPNNEPAADPTLIYAVRAGDQGLWGIAKIVYGHGKYWSLIAKANPDVDFNALRVGQELIIPPFPKAQNAP